MDNKPLASFAIVKRDFHCKGREAHHQSSFQAQPDSTHLSIERHLISVTNCKFKHFPETIIRIIEFHRVIKGHKAMNGNKTVMASQNKRERERELQWHMNLGERERAAVAYELGVPLSNCY